MQRKAGVSFAGMPAASDDNYDYTQTVFAVFDAIENNTWPQDKRSEI